MTASDVVKVAKDGTSGAAPFNMAFQDKDGTGASLAAIHALRDSAGNDIDPATAGNQATANASLSAISTATGTPADAAYVSGSGGVIGLLKGIFGKLAGTLAVSWSGQSVAVSNFPSSQTVAGSVAVSNLPGTQAISAASLPLPTGAALEAGGNIAAAASALGAVGDAAWTTGNGSTVALLKAIAGKFGAVVLGAGSALIGKVGIDQTTPGTTNGVVINSSATVPTTETYTHMGVNLSNGTPGHPFSVAQTPVLLADVRAGRKEAQIVLENNIAIRINNTSGSVSATSGALIGGAAGYGDTVSGGDAIYGYSPSGTAIVSIIEVF